MPREVSDFAKSAGRPIFQPHTSVAYRHSFEPHLIHYYHPTPAYRPPAMATGVDAKLLKSTKFPPEYSKKVDMEKVNLEVMKQ